MPVVVLAVVMSLLSPFGFGVEEGCPFVEIIGVRGSGQTGFGEQVLGVVDAVSADVSAMGLSVSKESIDYPAVSISDNFGLALFNGDYNRSVATGAENLVGVLDDLASRCQSTVIVLTGYSQGAQVIKAAMANRPPVDRIGLVVLLADPSRQPLQLGVRRFGNVDGTGALGSEPLAEQIRPMTIDVCAPTDAVCSGTGLDFGSHINGYGKLSAEVLDAVSAILGRTYLRFRPLL
jgi:hypothetical protein